MELQKIKDELKEMYPKMQGFIQHTLVAEMCLKWHEKKVKNCSIPDVAGQSKQFYCFDEKNKRIDCCMNQCDTCKELKLMQ